MKDEDKTREQLIRELVEMRRQIIQLQKLETRQRRAEEELQNISEGSGDAMASHRPYRPALGIDKALEEISINSGKLYDIKVVDACLRVFKEKKFKFK